MCAPFCSFCKKSASKLVPHYLCDCCLVHLECCEATVENSLATRTKTIIPDEDANGEVDCEICLEKYSEDELEDHQEMCTARLALRCSVCDEDYVNKEGLWNHLDLHEIADESKETHYQEVRATYKLHKCVLCNDQRGYQESMYWRHVHEDHDGFFLRCLDCGENFRSEKRKTDHALSNCNANEPIEASDSTGLEVKLEIGKTVLAELIRPEESDLQKSNGDLLNSVDDADSQFSEDPSAGNCAGSTFDNGHTNELNIEREISQPNPNELSIVPVEKKCSYCDKAFKDEICLARHIEYGHQSFTCDICGIAADNRNQIRYHKMIAHTEPNYKCSICSIVFHFHSAYQRHMVKHEKEKKFPCAFCDNKFKSKFRLSLHTKRFHNCTRQATTELVINGNVQQQEQIVNKKCTYCTKEFGNEKDLSQHYKHSHMPSECNICKETFKGNANRSYHKLVTHTEPRHKCAQCQQVFHQKVAYQRHLSVHQIKQETHCDLCGLKFKSVAYVNLHKKRMHTGKKVEQKKIPCESS